MTASSGLDLAAFTGFRTHSWLLSLSRESRDGELDADVALLADSEGPALKLNKELVLSDRVLEADLDLDEDREFLRTFI